MFDPRLLFAFRSRNFHVTLDVTGFMRRARCADCKSHTSLDGGARGSVRAGSKNRSNMVDINNTNTTLLMVTAPAFNEQRLIKSVVLAVMALLSLIGNVGTLINLYRTQRRTVSTMYMLITQLAVADLLVTLFCVVPESVWIVTVQWLAGDAMCKIIKYLQMFSLYLSTFVLVLIGIDRFIAVRFPMERSNAHRKCNLLIVIVWVISALLSIPQVIIFRVQRGPFEEDFYQCVTHGYYTTEWEEQLYTASTLVLMFILPLLTIVTTYICTFYTIARNEQVFRECDSDKKMHVLRQKLFRKAKMKSLQITVVIVLAFVICWTPYYTMMITYVFLDPADQLSHEVEAGIFFFGMSNSMVNPLIYGAFHLRKRGGKLRYQSSRYQSQSTVSCRKRKDNTRVCASSAPETTCGVTVLEEDHVLNDLQNRGTEDFVFTKTTTNI